MREICELMRRGASWCAYTVLLTLGAVSSFSVETRSMARRESVFVDGPERLLQLAENFALLDRLSELPKTVLPMRLQRGGQLEPLSVPALIEAWREEDDSFYEQGYGGAFYFGNLEQVRLASGRYWFTANDLYLYVAQLRSAATLSRNGIRVLDDFLHDFWCASSQYRDKFSVYETDLGGRTTESALCRIVHFQTPSMLEVSWAKRRKAQRFSPNDERERKLCLRYEAAWAFMAAVYSGPLQVAFFRKAVRARPSIFALKLVEALARVQDLPCEHFYEEFAEFCRKSSSAALLDKFYQHSESPQTWWSKACQTAELELRTTPLRSSLGLPEKLLSANALEKELCALEAWGAKMQRTSLIAWPVNAGGSRYRVWDGELKGLECVASESLLSRLLYPARGRVCTLASSIFSKSPERLHRASTDIGTGVSLWTQSPRLNVARSAPGAGDGSDGQLLGTTGQPAVNLISVIVNCAENAPCTKRIGPKAKSSATVYPEPSMRVHRLGKVVSSGAGGVCDVRDKRPLSSDEATDNSYSPEIKITSPGSELEISESKTPQPGNGSDIYSDVERSFLEKTLNTAKEPALEGARMRYTSPQEKENRISEIAQGVCENERSGCELSYEQNHTPLWQVLVDPLSGEAGTDSTESWVSVGGGAACCTIM